MIDFPALDVKKVLSRLKPFQQKSVEYVFDRLYGNNPTHRFLLADEVGLGKTLVARGVIAQTIAYLREKHVPQVDIIYICSNQDIARQNLKRLNPTVEPIQNPLERITLLPRLSLKEPKRAKELNIIAITPGTSLDPKSGGGRWEERVLIYHLLKNEWDFQGLAPINVFCLDCKSDNFRSYINWFHDWYRIDEELASVYVAELRKRPDLKERFAIISEKCPRWDSILSSEERDERLRIITELREVLAKTCIRFLEPDLIILDEFQRFKSLLDPESEQGELAHELFEYSNEFSEARVLLLSATPYKMYTMGQEAESEDHYKDFVETLKFLLNDGTKLVRAENLLKEYRQRLYRIDEDDGGLSRTRDELESILHAVISRTERLAVTADRSGMLREKLTEMNLNPDDIKAYLKTQKIARRLNNPDIMEYWKSAPYLLNFMDDYKLKRDFREYLEKDITADDLSELFSKQEGALLPWDDFVNYGSVAPLNPCLSNIIEKILDSGAWQCLWIPPSLPYYAPAGTFASMKSQNFTKFLIFSSWQVVPKTIAALLSYEVERRMMIQFDSQSKNTPEAREKRKPLLNFSRSSEKDRLTGMPLFDLIYPSVFLATKYDPLLLLRERDAPLLNVAEAVAYLENLILKALEPLTSNTARSGPEDETWYWAAPILLDRLEYPRETEEWWSNESLAAIWSGESEDQEKDETVVESNSAWNAHVDEARKVALNALRPLGRPPQDLAIVLAQMALASPAVASLRAIARVAVGTNSLGDSQLRNKAGALGWAFRSLFNTPEHTSLIRGQDAREPYWRRVLEYCVNGNLQSTLDEFAHVLKDLAARVDGSLMEIAEDISSALSKAISIRIAQPGADRIWVDDASKKVMIKKERLRSRFAMRYGDEQADDGKTLFRADNVRQAFNSPFWPFVLITTSVGQEGLDFHPYCHAVVHWNLPSNPVDLEQREGRVHRFKGHAVRRNIAIRHGRELNLNVISDPWQAMFEAAETIAEDKQGLNPYWVYPIENGAVIERHVMALPLSKEAARLPALRKSLAVYRMVFGQPRQDDLVEFLNKFMDEEDMRLAIQNFRIDLSPR